MHKERSCIVINIYERLKDLREDKELNQSKVAEIIGTSQSYYAQYENGKRPIPFDRVVILARFYEVSIDYIAGLTNDKRGLTRSDLAEDETALIKAFRSFSERQKGRIEQVIKDIEQEQEKECKRKEA